MSTEIRIEADEQTVRRLLEQQMPAWADLPLHRTNSSGVDNVIYRLGSTMSVRLPQTEWSAEHVRKEQRWLPELGPRLPLATPVPLGCGVAGDGFPWPWSVYEWLPGDDAVEVPLGDVDAAARDLGAFVRALQGAPTEGAPLAGTYSGMRGRPLQVRDEVVRSSIANLEGRFDVAAATDAWEAALRVPTFSGVPVWLHGDLHPGNVLVRDGRVGAVIDWGLMNVGDPALDVMAAWTLLPASARETFRDAVGVDDDTWARGRGWALCVGLIATAYYGDSNPVLAGFSRRAAEEAVADHQLTGT